MIRFTLKCENDHGFESWFQSNDAFDALLARDLVTCPDCGTSVVSKGLMAPKVQQSRAVTAPDSPTPPQPMSNSAEPELVEAIKKLKAHVEDNSDYVGKSFASEARAMHEGEKPHRAIHGEANADEAKKLIEDGVPALPLPFIPRQKTN